MRVLYNELNQGKKKNHIEMAQRNTFKCLSILLLGQFGTGGVEFKQCIKIYLEQRSALSI